MTDKEAMDQIRRILSGSEWDSTIVDEVADVVRKTGREVDDTKAHGETYEVEGND